MESVTRSGHGHVNSRIHSGMIRGNGETMEMMIDRLRMSGGTRRNWHHVLLLPPRGRWHLRNLCYVKSPSLAAPISHPTSANPLLTLRHNNNNTAAMYSAEIRDSALCTIAFLYIAAQCRQFSISVFPKDTYWDRFDAMFVNQKRWSLTVCERQSGGVDTVCSITKLESIASGDSTWQMFRRRTIDKR